MNARWLVLVGLLWSCAGSKSKETFVLGRDATTRGVLLVAASVLFASEVCGQERVRGCALVDDAACVRAVGDAVIRSDEFDRKRMTGPDQVDWVKRVGRPAAMRAALGLPHRADCSDRKATPPLGPVVLRSDESAGLCVRLESDPTPCARAPGEL